MIFNILFFPTTNHLIHQFYFDFSFDHGDIHNLTNFFFHFHTIRIRLYSKFYAICIMLKHRCLHFRYFDVMYEHINQTYHVKAWKAIWNFLSSYSADFNDDFKRSRGRILLLSIFDVRKQESIFKTTIIVGRQMSARERTSNSKIKYLYRPLHMVASLIEWIFL